MSKQSGIYCFLTLFLCMTLSFADDPSVSDGGDSSSNGNVKFQQNAIDIEVYELSYDKWIKDGIDSSFRKMIAEAANEFCSNSTKYEACGLTAWSSNRQFDEVAVIIDESISYERPILSLKFALAYNGMNRIDQTSNYVPQKTLADIALGIRDPFYDTHRYSIVQIHKEKFGPVPNNTLDAIIISVSCVIVIALTIVVIICKKVSDSDAEKTPVNNGHDNAVYT